MGDVLALLPGFLTEDSIELGGTGGFEVDRTPSLLLIEPRENLFVLLRRHLLIPEFSSSARWN